MKKQIVSVPGHVVCFMRVYCFRSQQHAYDTQRQIWVYRMSSNLNVLTQFNCTLQLYAHIQNCWMIWTMHSCYIILLYNVEALLNNLFFGRWQTHSVLNIAHFKLLLWTDGNTFSRKNINAVSLGVQNTCPPNCAHIILIRSVGSPVWYFISMLLFMLRINSFCSQNRFDIW
jgi:hypothetical protein